METLSNDWKSLRDDRARLFAWLAAGVIVVPVVMILLGSDAIPAQIALGGTCVVVGAWTIAVIRFYFRVALFRCPRCKGFFQSRGGSGGSGWLPRSTCGRCGLRLYQDG
ncbi:MAG TPA: hypothetical protein VMU33_06050 [Burkholderiaceae bacterium]|nr:hypothetical protein [Burkholderiaceae bacterium]